MSPAKNRTETQIIEVQPERRQASTRRMEEFGWMLVSGQEGTTLRDGQMKKLVKLVFTRTATHDWIGDMKLLEKEFGEHDKSVRFGADGLVIVGDKPSTAPPIPILIVIAFAGYLAGWFIFEIIGGIIAGIVSPVIALSIYRQRGMKKLRLHTAARQKATDIFRKKRHEILVRVRAHANTRESSLERPPTLPS